MELELSSSKEAEAIGIGGGGWLGIAPEGKEEVVEASTSRDSRLCSGCPVATGGGGGGCCWCCCWCIGGIM